METLVAVFFRHVAGSGDASDGVVHYAYLVSTGCQGYPVYVKSAQRVPCLSLILSPAESCLRGALLFGGYCGGDGNPH